MDTRGLFDDNRAYVAVNGSQSEFFPLLSGVLQGSPLSPILYALFIDDIVSELNSMKALPGASRLGGRLFRCLLYANDIVIFSNDSGDLDRMLYVAEQFSLLHRFRFGIKSMLFCNRMTSGFQLYGETLPEMNEFIYLGIPFTANGIAFQVHAQRMSSRL